MKPGFLVTVNLFLLVEIFLWILKKIPCLAQKTSVKVSGVDLEAAFAMGMDWQPAVICKNQGGFGGVALVEMFWWFVFLWLLRPHKIVG